MLSDAGATVLVGVYPPAMPVLKRSMRGEGEGVVSGVYPLDATFSTPEEVTEEIKSNRRLEQTNVSHRHCCVISLPNLELGPVI